MRFWDNKQAEYYSGGIVCIIIALCTKDIVWKSAVEILACVDLEV